jgi:hypothetical protein
MRHWIDHTGIHQFARCHSGKAQFQHCELELSGFLQLATQIVFAERIYCSNLEIPDVQAQSQHSIDLLIAEGLATDFFSPAALQVEDYQHACRKAVAKYVEDFEAGNPEPVQASPPLLAAARPDIAPQFANYVEVSHQIVKDNIGPSGLDEVLNGVLQAEKSGGAEKYMIATLRSSYPNVCHRHVRDDWSLNKTHDLCVRLRYYLNQELAAQARCVYVPAVARARVVHHHNATILGQLEQAFSRTVTDLRPVATGIPTIAGALVRLGKAEPHAIAREALRARIEAKTLRAALATFASDRHKLDSNGWHDTRLEIRDHVIALRQSLGLEPEPRFIDAFEVDLLGMTVTASPGKLGEWWAYRRLRPRISILGEFAKVMADERIADDSLSRKLERLACSR